MIFADYSYLKQNFQIYSSELFLKSWHGRCVWKVTGLLSQARYFNSKSKQHVFLSFVIILETNALSQPSLQRFYALLGGFSGDVTQLRLYDSLNGLHTFKTRPFDNPLGLVEKKKVKRNKIRWMRFFMYSDVPLGQELSNVQEANSCYFSNMSKSSVIIFQTLFFFISSWFAIIWTIKRWSPQTTRLTRLTLTSVLLVESLPLLESSFNFWSHFESLVP